MFSTGLKESILEPLVMNYYGYSGISVAKVLSAEIFTFVVTTLVVGIIPESKKNYACMALVASIFCCVSLPITGLNGL